MIGQIQIGADGELRDKVETAIRRLQAFEPEEGYYLCFSGGKDSQCIYHLARMAGVKFDAHYNVTGIDPPELVRFIRQNYPDVIFDHPKDAQGKPWTMWRLIQEFHGGPSRNQRFCCKYLKESGGKGRVVVTGVRWAESSNRAANHDVIDFQGRPKETRRIADEAGVEYKLNKRGNVIMNDDNDEARRMVEQCYRTRKTIVNPIVDWDEDDVWDFLNSNRIPHCSLYDEGYQRLGCIGCPLAGAKKMARDFERWPKFKALYEKAFAKALKDTRRFVLKRIHGAEYMQIRPDEVENPGEAYRINWIWFCEPRASTVPEIIYCAPTGKGEAIKRLAEYGITIHWLEDAGPEEENPE